MPFKLAEARVRVSRISRESHVEGSEKGSPLRVGDLALAACLSTGAVEHMTLLRLKVPSNTVKEV